MGSVRSYESAAGKRWRARWRGPDHRQQEKRGFTSKKQAELWVSSHEVDKAKGVYIDFTTAKITVAELGATWLSQQTHLKPSTYRSQESAWRNHVLPFWGRRAVGDIVYSEVQAWVTTLGSVGPIGDTKDRKPLSSTSVKRAHGVLAAILEVAVRDRRIQSNPARGVHAPRKVPKQRNYLTHEQVELLASNAGERATLVRFLAYTGLRWGEATGLRVRHFDPLRKRVLVAENAVMVGGKIVTGTPKTHQNRSVPVPTFLVMELSALCEGKDRSMLIFGDGSENVRPPDTRTGWWIKAVEASAATDASFPIHLTRHELRHTAASLAISANANPKLVQRMLGHASAAMTLDTYGDLFDRDLDAVSDALDLARTATVVGKSRANGTDNVTAMPLDASK